MKTIDNRIQGEGSLLDCLRDKPDKLGLDITLKARDQNKVETETCYQLSRAFCRLICDLVDQEVAIPEILQLFELYQVEGDPVVKANVWEMDQRVLYGGDPGLTKIEMDAYHEASWQPVEQVLASFEKLASKIEADPSRLKSLKLNYDWMSGYFAPFQEPKSEQNLTTTLAQDLNTAIQFLNKLQAHSEVRFHFF